MLRDWPWRIAGDHRAQWSGQDDLLRLVSGKTRPSAGKVYFDGKEITNMDESEIAHAGLVENSRPQPYSIV